MKIHGVKIRRVIPTRVSAERVHGPKANAYNRKQERRWKPEQEN